MTKKSLYYDEAERLYVIDQCTINEVADRLKLGEKTVRLWKADGDWDSKRKQHLRQKEAFHEELYGFARTLMKAITEDMANGEKVDSGRLYTLGRLLPMITKVKDYEDAVKKVVDDNKPAKAGLTEDVFDMIQEQVFGLKKQ